MASSSNGADRINLFALVVYIPDPLATFLDRLRKELVPGCLPRAHVTILPPRPLAVNVNSAVDAARGKVSGFPAFEIAAGDIEIFPGTDVIHIDINEGEPELREMHRALNKGALAFDEPYPYHPHITLAQNVAPDRVQPLYERACEPWAAFRHSRRFRAERAVFVQSTVACTWVDLEEFRLGGVPVG